MSDGPVEMIILQTGKPLRNSLRRSINIPGSDSGRLSRRVKFCDDVEVRLFESDSNEDQQELPEEEGDSDTEAEREPETESDSDKAEPETDTAHRG